MIRDQTIRYLANKAETPTGAESDIETDEHDHLCALDIALLPYLLQVLYTEVAHPLIKEWIECHLLITSMSMKCETTQRVVSANTQIALQFYDEEVPSKRYEVWINPDRENDLKFSGRIHTNPPAITRNTIPEKTSEVRFLDKRNPDVSCNSCILNLQNLFQSITVAHNGSSVGNKSSYLSTVESGSLLITREESVRQADSSWVLSDPEHRRRRPRPKRRARRENDRIP